MSYDPCSKCGGDPFMDRRFRGACTCPLPPLDLGRKRERRGAPRQGKGRRG